MRSSAASEVDKRQPVAQEIMALIRVEAPRDVCSAPMMNTLKDRKSEGQQLHPLEVHSHNFVADDHDARGRLVDIDSCMPKRLAVDADGDVDAMSAEARGNEVWPPIRRHFAGTMDVPISACPPWQQARCANPNDLA